MEDFNGDLDLSDDSDMHDLQSESSSNLSSLTDRESSYEEPEFSTDSSVEDGELFQEDQVL